MDLHLKTSFYPPFYKWDEVSNDLVREVIYMFMWRLYYE